jgi:nitrogen fixation protein NifU and related proteins
VAGQEAPDLDRLIAELLEEIARQEAARFSAKVLQEARHPRNVGAMLQPDGHAALNGACGDRMEVFLRLDGDCIERATFLTDGCGPTVACGSKLTAMAVGKTLDEAAAIRAADLVAALDGLPEEHVHCASLAVNTLRLAILSYQRPEEPAADA